MRSLLILAMLLLPMSLRADDPSATMVNPGGLGIFRAVAAKNEGNVCLSPYSIQSALAMTYAGAEGVTKQQMAEVLIFPESVEAVADGFFQMNATLTEPENGPTGVVRIANRLYGEKEVAFQTKFLDILKQGFGAPLEQVSFRTEPGPIRTRINDWVETTTEGRIADLIPSDAITSDTLLVLVNALYVKVPWLKPFNKAATQQETFRIASDRSSEVPMMNRTGRMSYADDSDFTIVGIPLQRDLEFVILLPKSNQPWVPDFPAGFTLDRLKKLAYHEVQLSIPKFRLETPLVPLKNILIAMGMPSAFDVPTGSADFNGMTSAVGPTRLSISDVFHKTFLEIDEEGLEAAAATAVVMSRASAAFVNEEPIPVKIDRPFLFVLRHVPSNTCLFLGRVVNPK